MSEHIDLRQIMKTAGNFAPEAYRFLHDGLAHTVTIVHGDQDHDEPIADGDDSHHVSGQQLCLGLRDYAIKRYGMLARTVLDTWGISRTDDFGKIVFALIDARLMRKTSEDRYEDFQSVYDFDEAFGDTLADSLGTAD